MNIVKLYADCSRFVEEVCRGRDPSHGWNHMRRVADLSMEICGEMNVSMQVAAIAVVVAWLHDVADHKYDEGGELRERMRGYLAAQQLPEVLLDLTDNVSWSHEKKMKGEYVSYGPQLQQLPIRFTDDELTALRIVRDADRLEALGAAGVKRCAEYTAEAYFREHGRRIQPDDLARRVRKHADEKLLKLASEYIVTPPGKRMAETRHNEFLSALVEFEVQCLGR